MNNLREILVTKNKFGFIALFLGLLISRLMITQGYILSFLDGYDVNGDYGAFLINFGWFRLTIADIEYPIFTTFLITFIARIKTIKLGYAVLLYIAIDFIHNLLLIYFLSSNWNMIVSIHNSFAYGAMFLILGLMQSRIKSLTLLFALAFWWSDQVGFWISFSYEYVTEEVVFDPWIVGLINVQIDRFLIGLLGGFALFLTWEIINKEHNKVDSR